MFGDLTILSPPGAGAPGVALHFCLDFLLSRSLAARSGQTVVGRGSRGGSPFGVCKHTFPSSVSKCWFCPRVTHVCALEARVRPFPLRLASAPGHLAVSAPRTNLYRCFRECREHLHAVWGTKFTTLRSGQGPCAASV